ncbi:HTH-psq domain containing protein [Pyrenophora tritici-repentis]|uniref:HTH-psq domain containing protein n=1 Tax=Pyrenophora tritici-repentis TaxID=45151 RepID=A0A922NFW3_9PLEO|nr:HTH-psq domain-containing protein [Pyrenophora tritici-repentis]KAI0569725.1 HTH-psq domain-containing protein [Pyrenophora tritici-repentis]KAI0604358.1 HTH-psq domain-containing protein [Pyrenophora tritici-repentis]KAI0616625.1 HTH-psq domain-containing protein [Pyrenophora tritici-repentis]KAI1515898.1 HTH-psq domain containing protein [Pyrenophora tritici-repentis]
MDPREVAYSNAIHDLNAGVFKSQRQAAKAYGVPRSSLQERINGRQPYAIAHQQQQRLTPEQEAFLVDCVRGLDNDDFN